ncbi:MAG: hypothetical protein ACPG5P_04215 [Saprospiraceae bacterium]
MAKVMKEKLVLKFNKDEMYAFGQMVMMMEEKTMEKVRADKAILYNLLGLTLSHLNQKKVHQKATFPKEKNKVTLTIPEAEAVKIGLLLIGIQDLDGYCTAIYVRLMDELKKI